MDGSAIFEFLVHQLNVVTVQVYNILLYNSENLIHNAMLQWDLFWKLSMPDNNQKTPR